MIHYVKNNNKLDTRVKLDVIGICCTFSQTEIGPFALILGEENGPKRIRIVIGPPEAQAIVLQLENIAPPRPLTHDLLCGINQAFNIRLVEVFIKRFEEGVFYSELLLDDGAKQIRIDSRTSDAVALALRVKCPIYTTASIMQQVGEIFEDIFLSDEKDAGKGNNLQNLSSLLQKAIEHEDYETAAVIRDKMKSKT